MQPQYGRLEDSSLLCGDTSLCDSEDAAMSTIPNVFVFTVKVLNIKFGTGDRSISPSSVLQITRNLSHW